jgi:hypothetical protein
VPAAFSPSGTENGKKDKHFIVLKELTGNGAVQPDAQGDKVKEGPRVIIHRGGSTETLTLGH